MKNRILKISIIILELLFIIVVLNINIGCFFRNTFGIRCPGCGLTRAFFSILNLNFIDAFKYNIISIPLFIIIVIINLLLVYDIIFNENNVLNFTKKISKYYKLILLLILITFIVNNINKI